MNTFDINVQEPYFSSILSGKKTVEGRLNKGKFLDIQVGDILKINNEVEYKVVEKNSYKNFREMIEAEGLSNVIPDKKTVEEAVAVYYKFYTKEDELKYGVVGVKIVRPLV
ncbi:MAG: hypothetical protein A2534_03840 [Candidatus Magasanikbacteria bacterium RIFOXYD2_FULL_39_9]|uniref:ASCH domain-containing protein n=1 Tax=Candidatus Magasanikbacteria bacterium RIFOXYD1_FULL_40_23 TaxID=1798705 RepID=A0A1F6PAN0_9BACT|nr:MAG: hypothetical protein A2534_03840 [Candidatus Magasanikbacteria bacterium RIFOXYD2_FULL_39_9]OGH93178.1 MAG: hypothetical protein A2563_01065 [Candidatus Magasanikbacteria bacterium RIFOXYD1_FULL_40_23]